MKRQHDATVGELKRQHDATVGELKRRRVLPDELEEEEMALDPVEERRELARRFLGRSPDW